MRPQNRIKLFQDAVIATMFAILMIHFSGLAEQWLTIACGLAAAVSLSNYNVRIRTLLFLLVTCLSFLESAPWFLGKPSMAFGISGLVASTILLITPNTDTLKGVTRAIQILGGFKRPAHLASQRSANGFLKSRSTMCLNPPFIRCQTPF